MKQPILVIIATLYFSLAQSQKNNPDFAPLQLEDTSGNLINTASFSGKIIYVDFWFTACAPCIKEIPYAKALQQYFANDSNIVFLSICIENIDRKPVWKQMVHEKQLTGTQLFYARNRPQNVNLLRAYDISFPTYILMNKEMKVIGNDMPRPSETNLIYWLISQAAKGFSPAESLAEANKKSNSYTSFMQQLQNTSPTEILK